MKSEAKAIFISRSIFFLKAFHPIYEYKGQEHVLSKQLCFPLCCYRLGWQWCEIEVWGEDSPTTTEMCLPLLVLDGRGRYVLSDSGFCKA